MESGIKDNLSCGVCNHGLQNPKFSSKKSESRQRWVSGILIQLTWSPQSIVWNPEFKAWIPESKGAFHSTQNSGNFGWYIKRERTYSFWSDRNVRNQLWRWSTLTGLVISIGRTEMSLSVWQNCCPKYRSFVSCLQEQWPNPRWLESGLCNRNVSFHWARGSSESSNRNCSLVYPRLSWITLPGWNIMKYDIWLHIS